MMLLTKFEADMTIRCCWYVTWPWPIHLR